MKYETKILQFFEDCAAEQNKVKQTDVVCFTSKIVSWILQLLQ